MPTYQTVLARLNQHAALPPNERQVWRIRLLQQAATLVSMPAQPIQLFDATTERSLSLSQYDTGRVWMGREVLDQADFASAFASYLREMDHVHCGTRATSSVTRSPKRWSGCSGRCWPSPFASPASSKLGERASSRISPPSSVEIGWTEPLR
jgi:hypothetical protein